MLARALPMSANSYQYDKTPREAYQQSVIMVLGTRRQAGNIGATEFLLRYKTLVDQMKAGWEALQDPSGLPSPAQILTWL